MTTRRDPERTAALARLVRERLDKLGISGPEACRRGNMHRDAVRNIMRGSRPGMDTIRGLATGLNLPLERLLAVAAAGVARPAPTSDQKPTMQTSTGTPPVQPSDLPLHRQEAIFAADGLMIDTPVASIDRPAELEGRDTACAVYVSDDLNAPVIRAGDIAYVDPSRPLLVGRMVRAFPRGEAAYFAVLVARTDTTVKLQTATEPSPRAFARSDILRLERVTGWLQLEV